MDEFANRVYQSVTGPGLPDPEQADSAAKYEMSIFENGPGPAGAGTIWPCNSRSTPEPSCTRELTGVSVELRRVLTAALSD